MPDPTSPEQFNRYVYALNNPLSYTDPTGHCAGNRANPASENYDAECWQYLENEFCDDVACGENGWLGWLDFWDLLGGGGYFFAPWTKEQLQILAEQLQNTVTALGNAGINWTQTPLADLKIRLHDGNTSYWSGGKIFITPGQLINQRTLYHEIGHAFGLQRAFEEATNGGCHIVCKQYAAEGYYFREYGRSAAGSYNAATRSFMRAGETWADAFSVFVFTMTEEGSPPRPKDWGTAIDMSLFEEDSNLLRDSMLNIHCFTQGILVSQYGGR